MKNKDLLKLLPQRRQFAVEVDTMRKGTDTDTIRIAISSEFPVQRDFGLEVLDHTKDSIDLSRLVDGAPFCVGHDLEDMVGVLENVSVDSDRKIRGDVKFSRSQRGQDIKNDILDGIRKHISVGYRINKVKLEKNTTGADTYRVVSWMPYEASTVPIPADPTVGVGRSLKMEDANEVELERAVTYTSDVSSEVHTTTATTYEDDGTVKTVVDQANHWEEEYKVEETAEDEKPTEEATETGTDSATEDATEEVAQEVPDDSERKVVISNTKIQSNMEKRMEHIRTSDPVTLTDKEQNSYSVVRAIDAALNGRRDGFEFEVSDEIAKKLGRDASGFYMPTSIRSLSTTGEGSEMVVSTPGTFIDMLRVKTVAVQLGAQVIQAASKISMPRQSGASGATWVGEDGSGASDTDLTFDNVVLDPKPLIASLGMTKKFMTIASQDAEQIARNSFARDFAVALDRAVFQGSGSNQPSGLYYDANVNTVSSTSGTLPTFAYFVSAETLVNENNGDAENMAYVLTPGLAGKVKTTLMNASGTDSGFIWRPDGTINGHRAVVSNNLPYTGTTSHTAIFGDWSQVTVAEYGAIDVIVDPYEFKRKGNIVLTAQWMADVGILQPKSFALIKQVRSA